MDHLTTIEAAWCPSCRAARWAGAYRAARRRERVEDIRQGLITGERKGRPPSLGKI
ncbi:hypothetical protein [Nonomuraea aridisoli]|uniref:hypothetical protein n=1 Tax=Nonomuraea aridisoli TaxID=2070368 RepID=UPI0015E8BE29|nr:hypothetical protein [Nonomuraea aridisoli]